MKIVVVLNTHTSDDVVFDTIESVLYHMTDRILVVVDGAAWNDVKSAKLPVHKLEGFYHRYNRAPYRNVVLGLKEAYQMWPDANWYCYMEYDCLVTSRDYLEHLFDAERRNVWCLGNDHRVYDTMHLELLERIIRQPIFQTHYLLGACVFYHRKLIQRLAEQDFFTRFLHFTNDFIQGFFPDFDKYDFTEHLFPTLVHQFGGTVEQLAVWKPEVKRGYGYWSRFPVRFRPDFDKIEDVKGASIIHPLKRFDNPIRVHFREKRK